MWSVINLIRLRQVMVLLNSISSNWR